MRQTKKTNSTRTSRMSDKTHCGKNGQPPRSSMEWFCNPAKDLKVEYQCDSCREKDAVTPPVALSPGEQFSETLSKNGAETMNAINRSGKATKHNAGKAQWGLLLADFQKELHEMIKVRQYGIGKYEKDNWKQPLPEKDFFTDPAIRHIIADQQGDFFDDESNLPHLAHAAMSCLMALWHKLDNRSSE